MIILLRTIALLLGLSMLVGLTACDAPVEQKSGPATAGESKDGGKSPDAKTDAPTAIVSPDNPYQ
ncbi:MAG TPA: hypothetical protein VH765_08535 [Xanthobacteraceae bacterium]